MNNIYGPINIIYGINTRYIVIILDLDIELYGR